MTTRVRLLRRFPPEERKKLLRDRKRWAWMLRWYEPGGSMPSESIGFYAEARDDWRPTRGRQQRLTLGQAERARQKRQAELEAGTAKPRLSPSARMPWAEFVTSYLAETKGTMRDSSLRCVREAFDRFHEVAEPTCPGDVNAGMVKRFVQALRDKGRADATIQKHIAAMRRVWNDPATDLAKAGNPFVIGRKGLRIRLTIEEKEWHWYGLEELQSVLAACPDLWWRTLIFTAYTTALRLGEVLNARWCDLDLDGLDVNVRSREDDDACWEWVPKGKYRRTVPLTGHAAGMLKRLRLCCSDAIPYAFIPATRYAWIQRQRATGKWHSRREPVNNLLRNYKTILARAGVEVDAFHSLRKSCITNWLKDGVPPHEVQAMAGHASVETTMKYYAKVDIDGRARVRQASERATSGIVA